MFGRARALLLERLFEGMNERGEFRSHARPGKPKWRLGGSITRWELDLKPLRGCGVARRRDVRLQNSLERHYWAGQRTTCEYDCESEGSERTREDTF